MLRAVLLVLLMLMGAVNVAAQSISRAQNCIAIMGDSLPAGTFVAEIPGTGVTVLQSRQVAHILDDALQAREMLHYGIYDLSLPASAITDPNATPYLQSREYFLGRALNCRYVVIFPFLNDLYTTDDNPSGPANYALGLETFLTGIQTNSPESHIVLMNFYHTTLQGVGDATYGGDVSPAHVGAINSIHTRFCSNSTRITCFALGELLNPISDYIVGSITRDNFNTFHYTLANPADQSLLDAYWTANPGYAIYGDGLHLNPDGQVRVVANLMRFFAQHDPINFAPI